MTLIGCTSTHIIKAPLPAASRDHFDRGERLELTKKDGQIITLTFDSIDAANFIGFDGKRRVAVPLDQIRDIRHRDVSIGKSIGTTAIALGAAFVLYIAIILSRLD
ncbi:hypothetical protein E4T66_16695 [Sinimarinibacterium sp. CAU 1509]|uniref:hypothetical protein n=1 Tax=Sinimarinibacterium sp. CAU 1509 TaxID=2562283 RepID=UPI0010AB6EF4|nr:hypothetical protein [Sinimarinibacterium sp. CAU 1509]TJY58329.1 hypothetical protein E4T66_16695 [Sinimarinibacterium sp. CAU 1509]